jgi:L-ascorbate metabolism protein UlaG (beta-lactamase superfamily)
MKTARIPNGSLLLAVTFASLTCLVASAQDRPSLAISQSATNVTLSWGTNSPDFMLESADQLTGSWTNVSAATNGTATLPMLTSNQFFRLKETVSVTYILNEGFLISGRGKKVLIDGIFDKAMWDYYAPSSEVLYQQTNALPPFDNLDALLFSHTHTDHLQPRFAFWHLTNDLNARLIGPQAVYNSIRSATGSRFWMVTNQIMTASPANGSSTNVSVGDLSFKVVGLTQSDDPVFNVGFLFTLGGLRFLHVGDNYSTNLFDYTPMEGEQIDVAMINCYLFNDPQGAQAVMNFLHPRTMLVMHGMESAETYRNIINGLTNVPPYYLMSTNPMITYRFPAR